MSAAVILEQIPLPTSNRRLELIQQLGDDWQPVRTRWRVVCGTCDSIIASGNHDLMAETLGGGQTTCPTCSAAFLRARNDLCLSCDPDVAHFFDLSADCAPCSCGCHRPPGGAA